jgi:hypothetical protein
MEHPSPGVVPNRLAGAQTADICTLYVKILTERDKKQV